jgi:hypothetical protein
MRVLLKVVLWLIGLYIGLLVLGGVIVVYILLRLTRRPKPPSVALPEPAQPDSPSPTL